MQKDTKLPDLLYRNFIVKHKTIANYYYLSVALKGVSDFIPTTTSLFEGIDDFLNKD